jgi:hypothetical protein
MDIKEIMDEKRRLNIRLFHEMNEFEQKTGMEIRGITIARNQQGLESVTVKVEMPD